MKDGDGEKARKGGDCEKARKGGDCEKGLRKELMKLAQHEETRPVFKC